MITTPTVLVLGAGASYPYGFPTAKDLKQSICNTFSREGLPAIFRSEDCTFAPEQFFEFREAFLRAGQPSVDAFLERRQNFLGVGKLAIAFCLMPFETKKTSIIQTQIAAEIGTNICRKNSIRLSRSSVRINFRSSRSTMIAPLSIIF